MTPRGATQKRHRIAGVHKRTTKRGETRYRAIVDIGEGVDRIQRTQLFATQAEAEAWRAEMMTKRRTGTLVEPSRLPLSDWLDTWLAIKRTQVRPSTANSYARSAKMLRPLLGSTPLAKLTPSAIERAYGQLAETYQPATIQGAHRVLAIALKMAVRDNLLIRNPATLVSPPANTPAPRVIWTLEQSRVFLAGIANDPHADLWHLLLETWLRNGEVRALQWRDLDLTARTLTVARTATVDEHDKLMVGPPKSASSARTIALSESLTSRLRTRRAAQMCDAVQSGAGWREDHLVFPGRHGQMIYQSHIRDALLRTCLRLKLPCIRVHDLRHTGGSLIYGDQPIKLISERLGHASPAFTESIYIHTDAAKHRQLGDLIAVVLDPETHIQESM